MRQSFRTATVIPRTNQDHLSGLKHEGVFLTCSRPVEICKGMKPAFWKVAVPPDYPVITTEKFHREMVSLDPHSPHREVLPELHGDHARRYHDYRQKHNSSPENFPFSIHAGGFLFIERQGEKKSNNPRQFVVKKPESETGSVWSQPSGYAGGHVVTAMCRHIAQETGLIILDDRMKVATVAVPSFVIPGEQYRTSTHADHRQTYEGYREYQKLVRYLKEFDALPVKQKQVNRVRSALELEGLGDYRIEFQKIQTELMTDRIPLRDVLTYTHWTPGLLEEETFRAFVLKDKNQGSILMNLPFKMTVPPNTRIITFDPAGRGRETAIMSQDQLNQSGDGNRSGISLSLQDMLSRPSQSSYRVPKIHDLKQDWAVLAP